MTLEEAIEKALNKVFHETKMFSHDMLWPHNSRYIAQAIRESDEWKARLPVAEGSHCRTTHHACECMMKSMEMLRKENSRLRKELHNALRKLED